MASVNKVIILGRLGKDPELREANGTQVCRLAIATSRKYKDRDEEVEWHNVVLFGRTAEVAAQYLKKGSEAFVEGRLHTRSYEKDGVKRWATEIIGESLQLGARPKDDGQGQRRQSSASYAAASGRAAPADDGDVPF